MAWHRVHIGHEKDDATIGWLRVWDHEWRLTGGAVLLPPNTPAASQFELYEILTPLPVRFAAREISAGVWSFWTEDGGPPE